MTRRSLFSVPQEATVETIAAALAGVGTVKVGRPVRVERSFHDTFDWRVHDAGWSFQHETTAGTDRLVLGNRAEARVLAAGPVEGALPRFGWELPRGELRTMLGPVLDVRALLRLARVTTLSVPGQILDDETKTVVRLTFDHDVLVDSPGGDVDLGRRLRLVAVKGYERPAERAAAALADHFGIGAGTDSGAGTDAGADDVLTAALRAGGRHRGDYSSKLRLHLDPAITAGEAASQILRTLLAMIEANEAGTRGDVDSEFLHDLRVAVRRSRAALKALADVVPEETRSELRDGFAWLGQATSEARDLDVMVLDLDDHDDRDDRGDRDPTSDTPDTPDTADVAAELAPLLDHLRQRRSAAYLALDRDLGSERGQGLLRSWRAVLDQPWPATATATATGRPPVDAPRPVTEVASDRIRAAHRRVTRRGRAISATSAPEALHDLRKRCKELRYLLEFFASLYPRSDVDAVVGELKALQDNLGRFQDHQVQADALHRFAAELLSAGSAPAATLLRMGRLAADQERASERARIEFAEWFAAFDRAGNHRRFARLFAQPAHAGPR